jgi:hypothetical protein
MDACGDKEAALRLTTKLMVVIKAVTETAPPWAERGQERARRLSQISTQVSGHGAPRSCPENRSKGNTDRPRSATDRHHSIVWRKRRSALALSCARAARSLAPHGGGSGHGERGGRTSKSRHLLKACTLDHLGDQAGAEEATYAIDRPDQSMNGTASFVSLWPFAQCPYHASVGRHAPLHVFSSELRSHHTHPRECLSTRILPPSRFARGRPVEPRKARDVARARRGQPALAPWLGRSGCPLHVYMSINITRPLHATEHPWRRQPNLIRCII